MTDAPAKILAKPTLPRWMVWGLSPDQPPINHYVVRSGDHGVSDSAGIPQPVTESPRAGQIKEVR